MEYLVKTELLSVDAYIRTTWTENAFHGSLPLGGVPPVLGIGTVIYSKDPDFPVDSVIFGALGAQTISKLKGKFNQIIHPTGNITKNHFLTLLSITCGFTAWVGLNNCINSPKKGETVIVSGCSGGLGTCAAQFAKSTGARVIGVAGGKKKCDFLINELNLDGVIDYKHESKSIADQFAEVVPEGIDIFFDTIGGDILDEVLLKINPKARIVICGAISNYELKEGEKARGPSNYTKLAEKGATMTGFTAFQYLDKIPEVMAKISALIEDGSLKSIEQIEDNGGLKGYPEALWKIFNGQSVGKVIVKVD